MSHQKLNRLADAWIANPTGHLTAIRSLSAEDRSAVVDVVAARLRTDPKARETWRQAVAAAERKAKRR